MKRHAGLARRVDDVGGAADIDRLEGGAARGVDQPGDVDDGVGALAQLGEAVGAVERAVDPVDPVSAPPAAGQGADLVALRARGPQHVRSDEAGAAGHRQGCGCGS